MLFPLTHEDLAARRWPWVTTLLVVANVVVLLVFQRAEGSAEREVTRDASKVVLYQVARPYLPPCPVSHAQPAAPSPSIPGLGNLEDMLSGVLQGPALEGSKRSNGPPPPEVVAREQTTLDELCAALVEQLDAMPSHRFGFLPARPLGPGVLTHAFLHGGWVHVVFNMWFLWLCGCNLEDRWGRLVFSAFYAASAMAGACGHWLADPSSAVPMIGASGAVAGAMGAFLVAFARTRIRFLWLYFVTRWVTFSAPAYVMLPLWLGSQVLWGVIGDLDGVAYWAHVSGFVFGAGFAGLMRATGVERRLDAAIEASITQVQDARILRAADLVDEGRHEEALRVLDGVAAEQPASIDVELGRLRAAKAGKNTARERQAYARLIELYLDAGLIETAVEVYDEAESDGGTDGLPPSVRMQIGEALESRRLLLRAARVYEATYRGGAVEAVSVRAMVAHARVAADMGQREEARALLRSASAFTGAGELHSAIAAELARLG